MKLTFSDICFILSAICFGVGTAIYPADTEAVDPPPPVIVSYDLGLQITNATDYKDMVDSLLSLRPQDIAVFKLHNYGGSVAGLMYLLNILDRVKSHKIADVDGPTFSAGAQLACAMDEVKLGQYSYLMFHAGSISFPPDTKTSDITHFIEANKVVDAKLMDLCIKKKILTKEQAADVMKGIDIYVFPEDLK